MAITLVSQPSIFSFSANPVKFKLQSDNNLVTAGVKFIGYAQQAIAGGWTPGTELVFRFGDEQVTMTAADAPDLSGNQFKAANGAITLTDVLPYFQKNYVLSTNYDITLVGDKIYFTAKKTGTFYNWIDPGAEITSVTTGVIAAERPNFKFLFEIFMEDADGSGFTRIYSEKLNPDLPFTGQLNIDIQEFLDGALSADVPNPNTYQPFNCNKSKRIFYCRYAEVYGINNAIQQTIQTSNYHIADGGFSYIGAKLLNALDFLKPVASEPKRDIFLKQGIKKSIKVRADQPEFLYFINLRSTKLTFLKTSVIFTDGTNAEQKIVSVNMLQYKKYAFATGYKQQQLGALNPAKVVKSFSCCLVDADDNRLSEIISYQLDLDFKESTKYFLYSSSLGAFDTFLAYGKGTEEKAVFQQNAEKQLSMDYELADGSSQNYDLRVQRNFVVNTGWIDKRVFDLLTDFYLAEFKYLAINGKLLPLTSTNKKVGEKKDGTTLLKQEIAITLSFDDYKFTEGDVDVKMADTPIPDGKVYFGPAATAPANQAQIKALPFNQADTDLEFILNTADKKIFSLALPDWKKLNAVFDLTSEEDITTEYSVNLSVYVVDGIPYKLYTMVMALPYSTNHQHKIEIVTDVAYVPGTPPPDISNFIYFGSTATRPVTDTAILALSDNQPGTITNAEIETGSNKFFTIAIPEPMQLAEALDSTSDEDVKSEYLKNYLRIEIAGQFYSVYTMQLAINYTVPHTHELLIDLDPA